MTTKWQHYLNYHKNKQRAIRFLKSDSSFWSVECYNKSGVLSDDGTADKADERRAEEQGVTEKLKAENQMLWVGMMNNIRNCAEEMVLKEIVYD